VPPNGVSAYTANTMYQAVTWNTKTKYYWRVVANNAAGSTTSGTWTFTTK